MRFEIGQEVWLATFQTRTAIYPCPDCGGTGRIRFLYPDDTIGAIPCEGCRRGYDAPDGCVHVYEAQPRAEKTFIAGVEVNGSNVEWKTTNSYRVEEDRLFDTCEAATERSNTLAAEYSAEQKRRALEKEKPTSSWSWHVHYHRRSIRDAEKQVAYHTGRLSVAQVKAKEPGTA